MSNQKSLLNRGKARLTKAIERYAFKEGVTTPEAQEIYSKMSRKKQRKFLDDFGGKR